MLPQFQNPRSKQPYAKTAVSATSCRSGKRAWSATSFCHGVRAASFGSGDGDPAHAATFVRAAMPLRMTAKINMPPYITWR